MQPKFLLGFGVKNSEEIKSHAQKNGGNATSFFYPILRKLKSFSFLLHLGDACVINRRAFKNSNNNATCAVLVLTLLEFDDVFVWKTSCYHDGQKHVSTSNKKLPNLSNYM